MPSFNPCNPTSASSNAALALPRIDAEPCVRGSWLRLALLSLVCASALGCGTNAKNVEECRQIELARCRAAEQCGQIDDVAACERYIADECRHGFPEGLEPSGSSISACVKAIDDVGACAKREGKKTAPGDCARSSLTSAATDNVCELVEHPEEIPRCSFLAPAKDEDDADDDQVADAAADEPGDEQTMSATDAAADVSRDR